MIYTIKNEDTYLTLERQDREVVISILPNGKDGKPLKVRLQRAELFDFIGRLLYLQSQVKEGGDSAGQ